MPSDPNTDNDNEIRADDAITPWPRHVVNITELRINKNDRKNFHLVLKIDKFSPDEISIKRNDSTLTVETRNNKKNDNGIGDVEPVTRSFQIPKGRHNKEFGTHITVDGLLDVAGRDSNVTEHVIPINLKNLPKTKPGTVIRLDAMGNWKMEDAVNMCPKKDESAQEVKQEKGDSGKPEEEKVVDVKLPEAKARDNDVPGDKPEDIAQGFASDESASAQ